LKFIQRVFSCDTAAPSLAPDDSIPMQINQSASASLILVMFLARLATQVYNLAYHGMKIYGSAIPARPTTAYLFTAFRIENSDDCGNFYAHL
jgi:hypothetical protein